MAILPVHQQQKRPARTYVREIEDLLSISVALLFIAK